MTRYVVLSGAIGLLCLGIGAWAFLWLFTVPWILPGILETIVVNILRVLVVVETIILMVIGTAFLWNAVTDSPKTVKTA